jgi:hypothetical protein
MGVRLYDITARLWSPLADSGMIAASGAVRFANPTSSACFTKQRLPISAPTVCCVARMARAAISPLVGGRWFASLG